MNKANIPVITIDGPSGTGKGTLCRLLAQHLGWHMLDSGAIYRVLAFAATEQQLNLAHVSKLAALAENLDLRFVSITADQTQVFIGDQDVTMAIRSETCGQNASQVAAIPEVRQALLERQRRFAQQPGLVTDGRDMGTVVFPNALLKLFLYANEQERANRRYLQLKEQQNNVSLAQVVEELAKRDTRDAARACAPLKPAADAVMIDTTGSSIVQVFHKVVQLLDDLQLTQKS